MSDEEKRVVVAYTETEANTIRLNLHNETMVKMHNNLSERIGELEAWNKQNVGIAQYNLWKEEIAELKERVEGLYESIHGIAPDQADVNTEVLRDLLAEIFIFTYPDDPEERKKVEVQKYRELLEKLDVGGTRNNDKEME